MLMTIFSSLGRLSTFSRPNFFFRAGMISFLNRSRSRAMVSTLSANRTTRLHDLAGEADDLAETAVAQLAGDRAEDARPPRVLLLVDEHQGVAVEPHVAAVVAAGGLL